MSDIYSVTQLNKEIKELLEGFPPFHNIFVQGEVSNYKLHFSGHHYMTLKDEDGAINAVLFRSDGIRLRFLPENGMKVVARGRISAFPKTGQVQLYISDLMPYGAGALHLAFEQLKKKLHAEGLFDSAHKRSLCSYPRTIALVTSPTGAAVHDMLRILKRRWPLSNIQLFPALVQGPEAPKDLRRALADVQSAGTADFVIIGRGGGSIEDLWAFNDEHLARAIYACCIPVISAVGHEPDVTISDLVADLRAPTPSGAAEMAVPDIEDIQARLRQYNMRLATSLQWILSVKANNFTVLSERLLLRSPLHIVRQERLLFDHIHERLMLQSPQFIINARRQRTDLMKRDFLIRTENLLRVKRLDFTNRIAVLDEMSPLKVLQRGYSFVRSESGKTITSAAELKHGHLLNVTFASGSALCSVLKARNDNE